MNVAGALAPFVMARFLDAKSRRLDSNRRLHGKNTMFLLFARPAVQFDLVVTQPLPPFNRPRIRGAIVADARRAAYADHACGGPLVIASGGQIGIVVMIALAAVVKRARSIASSSHSQRRRSR